MADGSRSLPLDLGRELVVDLFAGGGGASLGIANAYREPDIAVNHNPIAIAVHTINHPQTTHFTCDVFEVDPVLATGGHPVGVLWASPDCRHHSKAKGGKPRNKKIRGLAWVVIKWASAVKPRLIHLENVEEFADWGPLLADGSPCKVRKGMTFRRWVKQLENLGYTVEHRELVAADYGAPTIRKRLYVIARCDGRPIVWPAPTHAKKPTGKLLPWRTAAECIDFDRPARSIFGRKKPLAINTQRRIAKGLWRYVLNCAEPFIVSNPEKGANRDVSAGLKAYPTDAAAGNRSMFQGGPQPIAPERETARLSRSVLEEGKGTAASALGAAGTVAPFLTEHANASNQRTFPADEPLRTQCAQVKGGHFALAAAHITKFRANSIGSGLDEPLHTITAGGDMARPAGAAHALGMVSAYLEQANTGQQGRDLSTPLSTICTSGSHQQLVQAYFVKWYGNDREGVSLRDPMHTATTKDRIGLVQCVQVPASIIAPELLASAKACADFLREHLPEHFPNAAEMVLIGDHVLVDITLRMLAPKELAKAQGFCDNYILDRGADGKPISKTDQVRLIGNSVCPDVAEALIRANAAGLIRLYTEQAA